MSTTYLDTPIGVFTGYLWVNKPDMKYKVGGEYKAGLTLRGKPAQDLKAKVDAEVDTAFDAYMQEKSFDPNEKKEWSKHYPYQVETDDNGVETGAIIFQFRQNATLPVQKTGEKIRVPMVLYDASGKEMHAEVRQGSEGRVRFAARAAPQLSNKKVGVRLELAAVQVTKLAERSAGPGPFTSVPGGYVEEPEETREAAARRGFDAV